MRLVKGNVPDIVPVFVAAELHDNPALAPTTVFWVPFMSDLSLSCWLALLAFGHWVGWVASQPFVLAVVAGVGSWWGLAGAYYRFRDSRNRERLSAFLLAEALRKGGAEKESP